MEIHGFRTRIEQEASAWEEYGNFLSLLTTYFSEEANEDFQDASPAFKTELYGFFCKEKSKLTKAEDILKIIQANAELVADPRMDYTADAFLVPLDDINSIEDYFKQTK